MTTGFIILRTTRDSIWLEAYKHIRSLYDNQILILDTENDDQTSDHSLINTTVIKTDKDGQRLLPLFYLYKTRCFDNAIIILDTMFIRANLSFSENSMLWNDTDNKEIDLEIEILSILGDDSLISYYRIGEWSSCYKSCYCISLDSLTRIVDKIDIFSILNLLRSERYCTAMDRVLSCIFQYMKVINPSSIMGNINNHHNYQEYTLGEYNLGMVPKYPIVNIWGCTPKIFKDDSTFRFFTTSHVMSLIGSCRRICLFANYNATDNMQENTILYINELSKYYDRVIVIANDQKVNNILDLETSIRVVHAPNRSYDFGLWSRVVTNMEIEGLDELALINDSCHITKTLSGTISFVRNTPEHFVGLTDNHDIQYHIQSYFLVFKGFHTISRMKEFFLSKDMNISYNYERAVREFETTLTSYMKEIASFKVLYPIDNIYMLRTVGSGIKNKILGVEHYNSAWMLWDVLLSLGCPLLKKKRFKSILSRDDFLLLLTKFGQEEYFLSIF